MTRAFSAVRISARDAEQKIDTTGRLNREVGETLSQAKELVEAVLDEARRARQISDQGDRARDSALRSIADKQLDRYLDEKRIEAAATAAATLIRDAGSIRRDFDALKPWLTEFLRDAVTRLVGELGDKEILARLVAEGVAEMADAKQVTVLVHPSGLKRMHQAQDAHPMRFAGVAEIRADSTLKHDELSLEGSRGRIHAGLTTQVDALCSALKVHI